MTTIEAVPGGHPKSADGPAPSCRSIEVGGVARVGWVAPREHPEVAGRVLDVLTTAGLGAPTEDPGRAEVEIRFGSHEALPRPARNGGAPWILVSAAPSDDERRAGRDAGASDVLAVGELTPALLRRSLSHAIERRRLEVELDKLRASKQELVRRALFDDLTGLPLRALFLDRLAHCLERGERTSDRSFAVSFLDLDGFKEVNDAYGHHVGDRLLVAVARRLESCVRPGDTVARLSGDEFCVLLEDMQKLHDSVRVVERIRRELARSFVVDGREVRISSSVGLVLGGDYDRPEDLLRAADRAMYRAKDAGGDRFELCQNEEGLVALDRRSALEEELRDGVRRDEFSVHYQPVVALESGRVEGYEALLRWHHPTRGVLGCAEFIDALEDIGLIHQLGVRTLRAACLHARTWSTSGTERPFVGVNVSARELFRPTFVDDVRKALAGSGLPASSLRLEVSEEVLAPWNEAGQRAVDELRQLGVRIQIDDFGADTAPLGLLSRYPVDALKLAPSALFSDDERQLHLVRTLIELAHRLGLSVTAKGIESRERLARAKELGCDAGQGYLLGEAVGQDAPVERSTGA